MLFTDAAWQRMLGSLDKSQMMASVSIRMLGRVGTRAARKARSGGTLPAAARSTPRLLPTTASLSPNVSAHGHAYPLSAQRLAGEPHRRSADQADAHGRFKIVLGSALADPGRRDVTFCRDLVSERRA